MTASARAAGVSSLPCECAPPAAEVEERARTYARNPDEEPIPIGDPDDDEGLDDEDDDDDDDDEDDGDYGDDG